MDVGDMHVALCMMKYHTHVKKVGTPKNLFGNY